RHIQVRPVVSIVDRCQHDEHQKRAATTVSIAYPSARVLVDAVEEVLARPEEPDGGDGCAEHLQVLRQEALPEVLAEREQEHRDGHGDDIALEAERLCY